MVPGARMIHGEALATLAQLDTGTAAAVITDPPYSSGGMMRSDRTAATRIKYTDGKSALPTSLDFAGDNRDGRGWHHWMALWLTEALRVTQPGGTIVMFTDWRQLPTATDALQAGGWVWRGILPWIKPDARPQQGRFTQHAEFILWGTAGPREMAGPCLPGYYTSRAPRPRQHITEKPVDVVRTLVRITEPGGLVLDPFAGSGTTGVAAVLEGRAFLGVELSDHYAAIADERIDTAQRGYRDDGHQMVLTG